MPIYAYKCESCGHRQDVLQKISDPVLTVCTACGAPSFVKQVTAAGFQLKGSGWYVTDFRDGGSKKPAGEGADKPAEKSADKPADKTTEGGGAAAEGKPGSSGDGTAAKPAAAPAPAAPPAPSP
jgi:putative FmdB family regulatory protein